MAKTVVVDKRPLAPEREGPLHFSLGSCPTCGTAISDSADNRRVPKDQTAREICGASQLLP